MTQSERTAWFKRTDYDRTDAETRKRLLEAAAQTFREHGYAKASIAKITEAAGLSRASFYVYFTSREEVFHVLVDDLIERTIEAQRGRRGQVGTDPHAALTSTIGSVLTLYADTNDLIALLEERAKVDAAAGEKWQSLWGRQTDRAVRWVSRLQADGLADPDVDARLVCEAMNAVLLHFGIRHRGAAEAELARVRDDLTGLYERMIGFRVAP
ncbi:TetR/AcrR family transcriptional regulator [Pseudonocardia xishanensis]|uniref:HTH tetR-type domain-containing protein n=1 Tax=Pseudonocardia xishanensis TaxID=630995 RepID=A0ABP8RZE8_9PSEU